MFTFSAGTDVDDAPAIDRNHDDDDTDDFVCLIWFFTSHQQSFS